MTLVREPEAVARERRIRGIRGRSFDVTLACFASAVGADVAILLSADRVGGPRAIASWARDGGLPGVDQIPSELLGRAVGGETAAIGAGAGGEGATAVAGAVTSHDQVLGVIYACFDSGSELRETELAWAVESYARLAALCMHKSVAVAAALGAGAFDSLTGCLAYGGVVESLQAEMLRSTRRGHRLSLCLVDLDGFAEVNAIHGHVAGNRVLASVATGLRFGARGYDSVGRLWGDRFAVVLPETDGHTGRRIAERLRASARSATAESTSVELDACCAVAEWDGDASALELIAAAEGLLLRAKARGPGQIEFEAVARTAATAAREPG